MIDFHCHIGRIKSEELNKRYGIPEDAGGDFLHAKLEEVEEVEKMLAVPYASPHVGYEHAYSWLLSETVKYADLLPVPIIHPNLAYTDRLLEELDPCKVPGIKLHCGSSEWGYSLVDHEILAPVFSYADEHDLILFIHTDTRSCLARDVEPLLGAFQTTRVVLLHGCREEGVRLTRYPSVFLETSGCKPEDIALALEKQPERVLFGSDFPFLDYEASLGNVRRYIEQIEKNEKRIFKASDKINY